VIGYQVALHQLAVVRGFIVANYNVDPNIFIAIYILATPSYYYGAFKSGREAFLFSKNLKRQKKRFNLHDLLLEKGFLSGYMINRLSWFAPYAYVLLWGNNLPVRFYLTITTWTLVSSFLFLHNLKHKSMSRSKKTS